MVRQQKPDMLCIQETKMEGVDGRLSSMLWGGNDFDWLAQNATERSGGMIIIWKKESFEMTVEFSGSNFLGVEGWWGKERVKVSVINVYAPCDMSGKRLLWEELASQLDNRGGDKWCILGDFNSIKDVSERKGVVGNNRSMEMQLFGDFISGVVLIDLPLIGRKYTWYKSDGSAMSQLDRFLILEEWLNEWPNLSQWGLKRSVSDHCAVVLKEKEINWGPKPFRMMKCWEGMEGYEDFVKNKWRDLRVDGWKGFVLKEKLKGIKAKLKEWNKEHFVMWILSSKRRRMH